jgi:DNA-binding FadR family transcriptional regulator
VQQSGEHSSGSDAREGARARPSVPEESGVPVTKSAHVIAARLRERIVRGEVAEGEPLPVESQLEAEFGASRPVLREALRVLENEGLVETRRGKGGGPRARHPTLASAAQAVGVHLQLRDVSIRDVWDAYTDIVIAALIRLGEGGGDLDSLRLQVDGLEALIGDADGFYGQIVATTEDAVRLAGNTTATILVGALRQIILAELGFLTRTNRERGDDSDARSDQSQLVVVRAWRSVLRHLQAGRGEAAATAYQGVAELIGLGVVRESGDRSVIDIFPWFVPRQASVVALDSDAITARRRKPTRSGGR